MNITIELAPAIEKQLRDAAARHNLDVREFAPQAIQDLLADRVLRWAENQSDVEAMLDNLAQRISTQREQARAAQRRKNAQAIALLQSWRQEDANVDANERAARLAEGKALEAGLAAHPFFLDEGFLDEGQA